MHLAKILTKHIVLKIAYIGAFALRRICVFCGASTGSKEVYQEAAVAMGKTLAENKIDLVYGGGNKGLMGLVADATIDNGGRAFGVIPKALVDKEEAHTRLSEQFVVNTMHERKMMMATPLRWFHCDARWIRHTGRIHRELSPGRNSVFIRNPVPYSISTISMMVC